MAKQQDDSIPAVLRRRYKELRDEGYNENFCRALIRAADEIERPAAIKSAHVVMVPWCNYCVARVPIDHVCSCESDPIPRCPLCGLAVHRNSCEAAAEALGVASAMLDRAAIPTLASPE